jgi:hypothetical protein
MNRQNSQNPERSAPSSVNQFAACRWHLTMRASLHTHRTHPHPSREWGQCVLGLFINAEQSELSEAPGIYS